MTFPQHRQAMIEHHDTSPEQPYTWTSQIKPGVPQQNPTPIAIHPTSKVSTPESGLTDLDTTKFYAHWSPETDHQLMPSRTIAHHTVADRAWIRCGPRASLFSVETRGA
ncbi:hypothetical protein ACIBM3_27995 [Rhodococcus erythropolis]|uniref:hypothetical protein n=1 Tax=Rhodococcus erythropolis TaxID=1833 RepID=UPI0037AD4C1A